MGHIKEDFVLTLNKSAVVQLGLVVISFGKGLFRHHQDFFIVFQ